MRYNAPRIMFERLTSFLGSLQARPGETAPGADDPRVAAAALMILVADADGTRTDSERQQLHAALSDAYGLAEDQLESIVAAGEAASREAIDFYSFTRVLNRHLGEAEKMTLIGLLWEMVYADGELHELEDNVVWRVAELIGVSQRDRVLLRQQAREAPGIGGE